jgi:hypothetical protein
MAVRAKTKAWVAKDDCPKKYPATRRPSWLSALEPSGRMPDQQCLIISLQEPGKPA